MGRPQARSSRVRRSRSRRAGSPMTWPIRPTRSSARRSTPIGAEIVEVPAKDRGRSSSPPRRTPTRSSRRKPAKFTAAIIKSLRNCKVIGLGSVGADTVGRGRGHRGRASWSPNVPDVFHRRGGPTTPMAMFPRRASPPAADAPAHRRQQGGRRGGPLLHEHPTPLRARPSALISFGNVAKAVARRCHAFGPAG